MLSCRGRGRVAFAVAGVLALACGPALAGPGTDKPDTHAALTAAPPARFFTINQVLSQIDAARQSVQQTGATDAPLRTAALDLAIPDSDTAQPPAQDGPFGLMTFRAPEGALWRKWRRIEAGIAEEMPQIARCRIDPQTCTEAARRFSLIVEAAASREGRARLERANRDVNAAIRYESDLRQHSEADRWSSPLTTLASGRGDCEDYAFAKYAVLRAAGVPTSDLKILLVRDLIARDDHAVLAARHEGRWRILDNRSPDLKEDTTLSHFSPLFTLDHDGVKLFAARYVRPPARDAALPAPAASTPASEARASAGTQHAGNVLPGTTPFLL